jgi:hypothetical protein
MLLQELVEDSEPERELLRHSFSTPTCTPADPSAQPGSCVIELTDDDSTTEPIQLRPHTSTLNFPNYVAADHACTSMLKVGELSVNFL